MIAQEATSKEVVSGTTTKLYSNILEKPLRAHGFTLCQLEKVHGVYHALVKGTQMYYIARDMCMSGKYIGTWASTVNYSADKKTASDLFDEFIEEEKRAN